MDILGVGPAEFFLVIIIALIFMGPKEMAKAGRTIGQFLRKIILSEEWRTIQQAGKELQHLPNRLIREAGIEEIKQELGEIDPRKTVSQWRQEVVKMQEDISAWVTPPPISDKTISPDDKPVDGSLASNDTGSSPYQS